MFEKLALFFNKSEQVNKDRLDKMTEMMSELIDRFPYKILKKFNGKIHPAINQPNWSIEFSTVDILWWKERFNNEVILLKEPTVIKHEILELLLNELKKQTDVTVISKELNAYVKELIDKYHYLLN
mgnify:CR=1 FL=1